MQPILDDMATKRKVRAVRSEAQAVSLNVRMSKAEREALARVAERRGVAGVAVLRAGLLHEIADELAELEQTG